MDANEIIKMKEYYKKRARDRIIKENYKKKSREKYKEECKEKKIIYEYIKLKEVRPIYRILNNLASRINTTLKKQGIGRELTYTQILGSKVVEFENYLTSKMTAGISFSILWRMRS